MFCIVTVVSLLSCIVIVIGVRVLYCDSGACTVLYSDSSRRTCFVL